MFPNVRLMIAAVFASVVVLTCGFGVFAAFRVSHEPLGRVQPAGAPMQLVADYTAPAADSNGTPNSPDSPAEMSGPQLGANAVNLSLLKPPVPQNTVQASNAAAAMIAAGMAEMQPPDRHAAEQKKATEPPPVTFAARIQDMPIQAADPGEPAPSDGATSGDGALPQPAAAHSAATESAADSIPPAEPAAPQIKAAAKTSSKSASKSAHRSRSGKTRHARKSRSHGMSKSADVRPFLAQCAAAVERNHGQSVRCETTRPERISAGNGALSNTAIGGPFVRPRAQ